MYVINIYILKCDYCLNFPLEYKLNEVNNFAWLTAIDSAPRIVPGTKQIFVETKN